MDINLCPPDERSQNVQNVITKPKSDTYRKSRLYTRKKTSVYLLNANLFSTQEHNLISGPRKTNVA